MIPEARVNAHGTLVKRQGSYWKVLDVGRADHFNLGDFLPDQAVAGWTPLRPPPRVPATVAGVELDDAPLICEADGCTRHPGHDGAHRVRDGAVTRRWKTGEVTR